MVASRLASQDLFAQSFDILPLFAGEFFGIVEQVLDRTVLADQLHGALLADARHAGMLSEASPHSARMSITCFGSSMP